MRIPKIIKRVGTKNKSNKMKKIGLLLIMLIHIAQSYSQSVELSYNLEIKNKIVKKVNSNKEILAKLKIYPKETQSIFIEKLATFYSLDNKDKNIVKDICFSCMISQKIITKNEAEILNTMLNSKMLEVNFLMDIIKKDNYSNAGAKTLLTTVATIFINGANKGTVTGGATSRGKLGKAIGAILGGGIGFWAGAGAGVGPGAFIGAAIGDAAEDWYNGDLGKDTASVIANPDGSDCSGKKFPFN